MAKNVNFYTDKGIDRRRKMAEALMVQGQQPKNTEVVSGIAVKQSPLAGLARALTSGLGGLTEGNADRMEQQKLENSRQTMADALEAYNRSQSGGETALSSGEIISWDKAPLDRAGAMYQNILMGNPDTAPLAMQQAMENIQYDQRFPKELELAKAKAAIEAQYRAPPALPTNYQEYLLTQQDPNFASYQQKDKTLKPAEMKEFFDQQDKINASSDAVTKLQRMAGLNTTEGTYEGPMAGQRAYIASFGGSDAANNTLELDNLAKSLAADILKSTFGGMPTEGERKFLVDLQGSANKPVEQRRRVIETGLALIKNRITQAQEAQRKIETGDYSPTQPMLAPIGPQGQGSNPAINTPYDQIQPVDLNGPIPAAPNPGLQQPIPQPGDVVDGMRFKGGNPADPNSWGPL